jgi:hypothetical protein
MQLLEELSMRSNLEEIIWNFSRLKNRGRPLRLWQNPHFYEFKILATSYGSRFRADPIHDFQGVKKVYILHDEPGHVYLETARNRRAFGNTWVPDGAIIFKGLPLVFCLLPVCVSQLLRRLRKARGRRYRWRMYRKHIRHLVS